MSNALTIIRALIIYGLCLPLAIFLGYLLAIPMDITSLTIVALVVALPLIPVLLRWHHLVLVASWNMSVVVIFLPGRPYLWIVMAAGSLLLSIMQRILNQDIKFLKVPTVSRPLIFLALVILITAQLTGGMGFRAFGGEAFGSKRYIFLLGAIVGYFALICRRVPPERAILHISLYFLCGITICIASLGPLLDPSLYFIFAIFPVEDIQALMGGGMDAPADSYARLGSFSIGAVMAVAFMLARHGIRGLFSLGERWRFLPFQIRGALSFHQPWRILLFLLLVWISLLGGFRSLAIVLAMTMFFQFYFEGLFRTRLLPILMVAGILISVVCIPVADKLPFAIQRSLSFLPLPIDPVAKYGAEDSSEWRLKMWRTVWSEVPKYLLLGKGYAINPSELEMSGGRFARTTDSTEVRIIAGDYHNGPLSVLIPLGISGAVGFIWFLIAALRVLHRNFRYGDPALRSANTFLLSYFIAYVIRFFFVFGSFRDDLAFFTGLVGLSISVNGGVCGPAPVEAVKPTVKEFRPGRVLR
ncbi:MAG: O-antigen ligase family protein [Verrucomicrobia bacterium]|jgi:hypothetical protein|nr:O-antigen ligase family protein [Verrucomicrobiota bacterium]